MSKTKGNVIDPIDIMNDLGTDALRFTMLVGSTPGINTNLSLQKVEANRNFANKVWNAGRFVLGTMENSPKKPEGDPEWTLADSWIWARMQSLIRNVDRLFNNHQYGEAGRHIYEFFWNEYADWYLEIAKDQISQGGDRAFYTIETLIKVLDLSMRLLHPFTPYVTEELWQHLKGAVLDSPFKSRLGEWTEALMIAPWPQPRPEEDWETSKVRNFQLIQEIVRTIRNLRAEKGIKPGKLIPANFVSKEYAVILREEIGSLATLAQLDQNQVSITEILEEKPQNQIALVAGAVEIYLPLSGLVDLKEEKTRLLSELDETNHQIERLEKLLSGPFTQKAPEEVVNKEKEKLAGYQETASTLKEQLNNLENIK
ncbi:MAG: class I tRNA ligase family protein, partial [Anaerolineales bacterium]|nr:class I tRNA ligase family protein [Anaerolineales bacterium]